ncbi:MAG: glycosyltransferase [Nannocystaceae bacterium]
MGTARTGASARHALSSSEVRVIVVAEHASARFGGEAILPLQYFRRLRNRGIETWLVVHERTRSELTDLLGEDIARVTFVPDLWIHKLMCRVGRRLPSRLAVNTTRILSHLVTQLQERKVVVGLVRRVGAHVVHEPMPVSPKQPSIMLDVGAPVIIGPMNGGMTFPRGFDSLQSSFGRRAVRVGRELSSFVNLLLPGKRRAAMLLVANARTWEALPRECTRRVRVLVENGVDLSLFRPMPSRDGQKRALRLAYLGRLVDLKAVDLLLTALALARKASDVVLDIIGDGPARGALEAQARELGLAGGVRFHGFVRQEQCPTLLKGANALILPSLCECGGAVVLEAMAMGLPVIATDWGGPQDYVTSSTGIRVPPEDRLQFPQALVRAMIRLADDPQLRRELGAAGRQRVEEEFDWERKIDRIVHHYCDVAVR